MNERQQYEKHLADKLHQLPVPDVEPNWQQMKLLLDKQMPRGGAYWRWITGLGILLFMLGGAWLFIEQRDSGKMAQTVREQPATPTPKQSTDPSASSASINKDANKPVTSAERSQDPLNETSKKFTNPNTIEKNLPNTSDNNSNESAPDGSAGDNPGPTPGSTPTNNNKYPRKQVGSRNVPTTSASESKYQPIKLNRELESANKTGDGLQVLQRPTGKTSNLPADATFVKNIPVSFQPGKAVSDISVDKLAGDSIKGDYSNIFPDPIPETLAKSSGKSKTAKLSAIQAVENRVLALGFSLPMGFPLGDQNPGAYNINAKPNRISDFLPAPHLQYHINNKVYLQTELQFLNPQFIQPVLLFQNKTEFPSTNTVHYNSIYARKLYYFNLPVGIHYSPFPHFYLGTGLQFSSLISGVAMHEETSFVIGSGQRDLLSQRYAKFKNDSISNRIDNSEFRLMLDANYYWRQFTVGLRYNQAFSNYVSFRLNNVSPLFTDKNKTLQFYLRYNLWEDYKRRNQKSGARSQKLAQGR